MRFIGIILRNLFSIFSGNAYFENARKQRKDYYRNVYLKSDAWRRKRYVVMKRDHWKCVYCGKKATQVHHLKYAKYNIGKEPIDWLVSVCGECHGRAHGEVIKI